MKKHKQRIAKIICFLLLTIAYSLPPSASFAQTRTFLTTDFAQTVTATHTFNPTSAGAPFSLGANALNQLITGLNADLLDGQTGSFYQNATNINAGLLGLARGGLGADLSATGGTNQFLKQSTLGGAITVGAIADADVPDTITLTNITQVSNRAVTDTTGTLPETRGGTNQTAYTLGDVLYSSAANTLAKLVGNITTAKQFLSQTGTGAASAAPAWAALADADIPASLSGKSLSGVYTLAGTPTLGATLAMSGAPNLGTAAAPAGTGFVTLLDFEPTTSSAGIIRWNGVDVIHTYGTNSIFLGAGAGNYTFTGAGENVGIGPNALLSITSATDDVAIGINALRSATTGSFNVSVGTDSSYYVTTGARNVAVGHNTAYALSTGNDNIWIGVNNGLGSGAGPGITASQNVRIGSMGAVGSTGITTGNNNVTIGYNAGLSITSGNDNVGVGSGAIDAVTTAIQNVAVGTNALSAVTTGSQNTGVGDSVLAALTTSAGNVGVGESALGAVTTGARNVAVGTQAGFDQAAGNEVTTGNDNTFIGDLSGQSTATQLSYATAIGAGAKVDASNQVVLGSAITDTVLHSLADGQRSRFKTLTELTTIAAAASTDTTIQIPANALVYGVSARVTVQPTGTATMDVGVAGATTRYGTGISTVAGTTNPGTNDGMRFYSGAASIRITPNVTPGDTAGRVRVTIHYIEVTAPAS